MHRANLRRIVLFLTWQGILPASMLSTNADQTAAQLRDLDEQIQDQSKGFKARMIELISGLESHSNYEVKFLAVRLSFNGIYVTRRSKSSRQVNTTRA